MRPSDGAVLLAVATASLVGCRAAAPVVVVPAAVERAAGEGGRGAPPPQATPVPAEPPARSRETFIRVLLATGTTVTLPEPGRRFLCQGENGSVVARGPLTFRLEETAPAFQVGAFASRTNAEALVGRLQGEGLHAELRPTAGGLDAVVVVAAVGQSAAAMENRLRGLGVERPLPVTAAGRVELAGEEGPVGAAGRFRIRPLDPLPVSTGAVRVRGDLVAQPAGNGIALINVLPLEEYLRGVVPAEMGPRAFPALEALKAQAVAARTYAVAHLREYETAGYDICATTACQVYQGVGAEHPLSDQAVAETAGLVATWEGKPIDAMYHSTCGGHTEDAAALLPERAAPYLRGVPCRGERRFTVGSGAGRWVDEGERLALVAERLAAVLGIPPTPAALATRLGARSPARGVMGLAAAFGVENVGELLHRRETSEAEMVDLLATFELHVPPQGSMPRHRWELAVVLRLAQLAGAVEERRGRLLPGPAGVVLVADGSGERLPLAGGETVMVREGSYFRQGAASGVAGSPATLWCAGGACPVLEVTPLETSDQRSAWNFWVREIPLAEAASRLGVEAFAEVVVTERGRSGRATQVELVGSSGRRAMAAFPFRLRLGLPDTLFAVMVVERPSGKVLRFYGRGWGHGIGLCQNGAYGLALGGATFEEILATYYTGVRVERWTGGQW